MDRQCRQFLVSGKVQGVWFRDSTRRQAVALGLVGQALNLPDGRVKVIACGSSQALEQLASWLWQGPPLARVTAVEVSSVSDQGLSGFTIG